MTDNESRQMSHIDEDILTAEEKEELATAEPQAAPITYTGSDFDVRGLVDRMTRGDIIIPTFGSSDSSPEMAGFQRDFVWSRAQMDRFIESLLMGYPIPAIMLVQQSDRRYLVLDGQQRLRTLRAFYEGAFADPGFSLENVSDQFRGLSYRTLSADQRRMLDDTFIQATIIRTDGTNESLEAIYQIFERINSGGTALTPHEIRVALYPGALVEFISRLNESDNWRHLYGGHSLRLRDHELILRIMALYYNAPAYRRPQKVFLNIFLSEHRELDQVDVNRFESLFFQACNLLLSSVGRQALRLRGQQINSAFAEALFVGLMRRLENGTEPPQQVIVEAIEGLHSDREFTATVSGSTGSEESVRRRIEIATHHFSNL
ncbi:DUF262 domain-containing protein [Streptomyces sp. NPDC002156]